MREDFKKEILKKYYQSEGSRYDFDEPHYEICIKECELQIEALENFMKKYPYDFTRLIYFASDMIKIMKEKPEILEYIKNNMSKYDSFNY